MWSKRRRSPPAEARALLAGLRNHAWKSDAEREDLLRKLAAVNGLAPEDTAWMTADSDAGLRQAGVALLQRFPFEAAAEAMFPFLAAHGDAARRFISASVEAVAGPQFGEHAPALLAHL